MILEKKGNELIELTEKKTSLIIDDTIVSPNTVYSSKKLDELSNVSAIDDSTVSLDTSFSSSKIDTLASDVGMPIVEVTTNTNNFYSPSDKAVCLYFKTNVTGNNISINGARIRYRLGIEENWLSTSIQSGTVIKCIKVGSYWICDGQTVIWKYSNYLWRTASLKLVVRPYYLYVTSNNTTFTFPFSEIRSAFDNPNVINVTIFAPYYVDGHDESEFGNEQIATGIATYTRSSGYPEYYYYKGTIPSSNNNDNPATIAASSTGGVVSHFISEPNNWNYTKILIKVLPWGDYYHAL